MKRVIIIVFISTFISLTTKAKEAAFTTYFIKVPIDTLPTEQLIPFLQQMNIESYYGKPVDSFLLAVPANLYNMKVYGGSNSQGAIFRASEMIVDFTPIKGSGPTVIIHVREFTHMNRYSSTATWDVNLFRKEKIYRIDVYKNQNICINGDCMN